MEEKNIISLNDDINESHVLVERNKRRERNRTLSYFKRAIFLIILACIIVCAIFLLPYLKNFFSKIGMNANTDNGTSTNSPPVIDNLGTSSNTNTESDTPIDYEFKINQNGGSDYVAINESGCEFDFSQPYKMTSLAEIYRKYGNEAPVVLVIHSNIRESYSNGIGYSRDSNFYSDEKNISEIGKIIVDTLNSNGVNAIQVSELYASGSIYGSRAEYERALSDTLKKYPSILYVFNISRAISINDDFTMDKATISHGESNLAQISIISGTNMDTVTQNQVNNVLFAFDFAKFANLEVKNFVKENKISRFDLSQDLGPVSVNLDIGEYSNTFEEAKSSAELFGTLCSEYLKRQIS